MNTNTSILALETRNGYNFWKGVDENGNTYYNITPEKDPAPSGGYYNFEWICKVKMQRYQPEFGKE